MASNKSSRSKTECKCPRCECEHEMALDWRGRGVPRKYCDACRAVVETYEAPEAVFHAQKRVDEFY